MSEEQSKKDLEKRNKKERIAAAYQKGISHIEAFQDELSKQAKIKKLTLLREKIIKEAHLSGKQIKFCAEYFKDFNIVQAGLRAGYAASTVNQGEGPHTQPGMKEYIDCTTRINVLETGVTAEFVVAEFNKLAKVKASDLYDENGLLIPPHKLPDHVSAAVSKVTQKTLELPNGTKVIEFSYQLHSKVAALDALGKHTGIYKKDNDQKAPPIEPAVVMYLPENGREAVITVKQ